jgi:Tol biopolymer transport system component
MMRRVQRLGLVVCLILQGSVALQVTTPSAGATVPGSNGLVAFEDCYDGPEIGCAIEEYAPDGTLVREVYHMSYDRDPAWSPTGDRLAVSVLKYTDFTYHIWIVNADGSQWTRLTDTTSDDLAPAWSPSGERIVFSRAPSPSGPASNLWIKNVTTGGAHKFTFSPPGVINTEPDWSPDGKTIVFARKTGSNWDLFMKNVTDGSLTRLTFGERNERSPSWSPDGSRIVYKGPNGLAVLTLVPREIDVLGVLGRDPSWSPDGTRVAYAGGDPRFAPSAIYVLRLGAGTHIMVRDMAGFGVYEPTWQSLPDSAVPDALLTPRETVL